MLRGLEFDRVLVLAIRLASPRTSRVETYVFAKDKRHIGEDDGLVEFRASNLQADCKLGNTAIPQVHEVIMAKDSHTITFPLGSSDLELLETTPRAAASQPSSHLYKNTRRLKLA